MKKHILLTLLAGLIAVTASFSQGAPQGFNYQSVIRNSAGDPLANQTVSLVFTIRSGSSTGTLVYYEKHNTSTNEFGIVNLVIGRGTPLLGTFSAIDWSSGPKFLEVSIETLPGIYDVLGSSELLSVPYALYAQNSGSGGGGGADNWGSQTAFTDNTLKGNGLANNPIGLAQQNAQPGQVLKWDGNQWTPANDLTGSGGGGGTGTVTQVNTGAGLTGGPITTIGTIALSPSGVTAGTYGSATEIPVISVDAQGRVTNVFKTIVQPGAVGLNPGTGINIQTNGFNNFTITNTGDTNPNDDLTNTSQADGDVSGVFNNLQLKSSVVGTTELANGAVTAAKLNSMSASSGQVLKWNGSAWIPSNDLTGSVDLSAGPGISISGTAPNYTITNTGDLNANDDVLITTQANGDVTGPFSNLQLKANVVTSTEIADNAVNTSELASGAVTAAKLNSMSASTGQVLKWNGSTWAPATDLSGSISLTAGAGINITGTAPDFTIVNTGDTNANDDLTTSSQANGDVSGPFSNLQIKANVVTSAEIADNAVNSSEIADNAVNTSEIANGAITAAKLDDMNASTGQVLKWNGTAWAPANDNGSGTSDIYSAGTGISITGTSPNYVINNAGDADDDPTNEIQVLSLNGNKLSLSNGGGMVTLPAGGGNGNTYTAGPGISITGTAPNLTINNTGDLDHDPTNELQTLALNGSTISISGTNSIDLAPLLGVSIGDDWTANGTHIFNNNAGNVLVGTNTSISGKLQVLSNSATQEAARFTQSAGTKAAVYAEAGAGPGGYFSSNSGAAIVTGTGNVGLGLNNPSARLHIKGNGESVRLESTIPSITFVTTGVNSVGGYIRQVAPSLHIGTSADSQNVLIVPGGKTAIFAEGTQGNVSIGSSSVPKGKLHIFMEKRGLFLENKNTNYNWEFYVNEDDNTLQLFNQTSGAIPAGIFALNGVYTPSDSRLKTDIKSLQNGVLNKIMQLNPVTYRYKVENANAARSMGFLAQDVDNMFPELVAHMKNRDTGEQLLSLNYAGFGVLAIKAIQEQQTQVEALKKENAALKNRVDSLESRLQKLENALNNKD